jgi:hypothetical protein
VVRVPIDKVTSTVNHILASKPVGSLLQEGMFAAVT